MNRYYNSRRNKVNKTVKDYLIPVVGIVIIIIILMASFGVFSSNKTTVNSSGSISKVTDTSTGILVKLDDSTTESYIYSGETKTPIFSDQRLKTNEKIVVKEGSVSIEMNNSKLRLNKLGELELTKDGNLKLNSESLWIVSGENLNLETTYSKIKILPNSIVSVSQNEAVSTIYVLSGFAEVSNLVGQKSMIGAMQKVSISNKDASSEDLDLNLLKDTVDDFFKTSDWYIKNNGSSLGQSTTSTGDTMSGKLQTNQLGSMIELDNLRDESTVSNSKLNITGKYFNDFVGSITLAGEKSKIDLDTKSFSFSNYILDKKENDLVFKLYDIDNNIIGKVVYTIYYNGVLPDKNVETSLNSNTLLNSSNQTPKNYSLDANKFKFTSPSSENLYTTYETLVTIRGTVPEGVVNKITVNGFTLSRFVSGSTSWRYHADASNDNLKEGTNIYEIRYYGSDGKLLYTNDYTIVKKTKIETIETSSGLSQ